MSEQVVMVNKALTVDGVSLSLSSVDVVSSANGFRKIGLQRFTATCPNNTDEEFKATVKELEERGYLVKWHEWKNNPLTMSGKKSFKLSAAVNPTGWFTFKIGDSEIRVRGSVISQLFVKEVVAHA